MSSDDARYFGILLEEIRDQNREVLEAVGGIQAQVRILPTQAEFEALQQDVKVIKAAVRDVSHQVTDHEHRITRLEAA
jgi:hypothetical protein